jgi:prepilin signal peptidase PulO-like enzyme (type II secretory pathway)
MLSVVLALAGIPAGFALDAVIVRLAVPPDDDDAATPFAPRLQSEAGALVLPQEDATRAWLRRLIVVAATAGLFALAGGRYDGGEIALVCAYVCVLLVCAGTDALAYRVPNVITYPAIVGALIAGALMPDTDFPRVLAGGALAGGIFLFPALLTGGAGMGMGDVKLAAFAGLALGFPNIAPALVFTALAGGGAALALLTTGARRRREPIPYAPFISAGALVALFWQGAAFA